MTNSGPVFALFVGPSNPRIKKSRLPMPLDLHAIQSVAKLILAKSVFFAGEP